MLMVQLLVNDDAVEFDDSLFEQALDLVVVVDNMLD